MAEPETATLAVATLPSSDDLERATSFAREPFLLEGEDAATALAPGHPAAARARLRAGRARSRATRCPPRAGAAAGRCCSGLDRLLSQDEPALVDGTVLSAHQVDALSGTLTALLAEAQRNGNGRSNGAGLRRAHRARARGPARRGGAAGGAARGRGRRRGPGRLVRPRRGGLRGRPTTRTPAKRFWFEHATGAGKTVAALGFVEASRTGGILILTHRRNLVDQFHGELRDRGYAKRIAPGAARRQGPGNGPVTVETYQWFVRNAGKISDAYTIVICDEAHTALGEKTSAAIRAWTGPSSSA
jgi:hypothetical protein